MDFAHALTGLLDRLDRERIRYATMGGFALGALGIPRATQDLDFLLHRDDLPRFERLLAELGYQRHFQSENVAQYYHQDSRWGAIDVILAFRPHTVAMLSRAAAHAIFGGTKTIKVLPPEDVIGLKVQAMANNPLRKLREAADIEALMGYYGAGLDWARILEYYDVFELGEEGKRLKEQFGHVERTGPA